MKTTPNLITSEKSKLSAAGWLDFMKWVEENEPVIAEEIALLLWAIEQPPGDRTRDHAFFEIGFRFCLHLSEQGSLKILGSSS